MAHGNRYPRGMGKAAKAVLAENMRALKAATPIGEQNGNLYVGTAAKIGESTVGRARRGDGNTTVETLDALAKYYKREAWELLCPEFKPGSKLIVTNDEAIEAEVHRRLIAMATQSKALEVSDEKARAGPSVAYPFGPVQDARPEPPPHKARAGEPGASAKPKPKPKHGKK